MDMGMYQIIHRGQLIFPSFFVEVCSDVVVFSASVQTTAWKEFVILRQLPQALTWSSCDGCLVPKWALFVCSVSNSGNWGTRKFSKECWLMLHVPPYFSTVGTLMEHQKRQARWILGRGPIFRTKMSRGARTQTKSHPCNYKSTV